MKHIKNQTGGYIIYDSDDWKAGLGPQGSFSSTQYLTQTDASGFLSMSNIDPFLNYGNLRPGYASGANATNNSVLAGVVKSMVLKDNNTAYGIDAGGKVQTLSVLTGSANTLTTPAHTISYASGSTYVGQDGILYKHNVGGTPVVSFFYSAYNSNNWDVGTLGLVSGTYNDVFMSGTPTTPLDIATASPADGKSTLQRTEPHPMEIGQDDVLYIGSGRYIHAYDGASGTSNGTFTSRVLTLPSGFQVVAMKKFGNVFLIAGNYYAGSTDSVGEAQLYTWNYTDSDISSFTSLEDFSVSALFSWKGSPVVITQGVPSRNGKNKVKLVAGNSLTEIASFDGTIPTNRGVLVINDIIYMNAGGKILSIGDKFKRGTSINHVYTTSDTGPSGCLLYSDLIGGFIASSGATPAVNTIFSNNGSSVGSVRTFFFDPSFGYGKQGRVKSVVVKYYDVLAAHGSNGTLTMNLNINNNTTQALIINGLSSVALPLVKKYSLTTAGGVLPMFSTIGFSLAWTASTVGIPVVSKIEIEYELVDISA